MQVCLYNECRGYIFIIRKAMKTKTATAIEFFKNGNLEKAFSIFKTFKVGFTKDEKRNIEIAYESLSGNAKFYQSLGIDVYNCCKASVQIIQTKYGI